MLNESMAYLDDKDWVQGYAWFGAFRQDDANEWTGDGVSMLDDDGDLTGLGAEYLGGEENGFEEGMGDAAVVVRPDLVLMMGWVVMVMAMA
jgi:hypothetical protein